MLCIMNEMNFYDLRALGENNNNNNNTLEKKIFYIILTISHACLKITQSVRHLNRNPIVFLPVCVDYFSYWCQSALHNDHSHLDEMTWMISTLNGNDSKNNYKSAIVSEPSPRAGQMVDVMMQLSGPLLDDSR